MALSDLLAALEEEGAADAAKIEERARADARQFIAEARVRLVSRRDQLTALKEARLRDGIQRQLAATRRSARRVVLLARQRLVERVYQAAERRVAELQGDPRLEEAIPKLVSEARVFVGPGATVETLAADGTGVIVTSADGHVTVDNTLRGRMARLRLQLAIEIVKRAEFDR